MSKDLMFKTATFGGFKKDDVMDFIEKILTEKTSLESIAESNYEKTTQLNNEIAELNKKNAELLSEIEGLRKSNLDSDELTSKVADYEKTISGKDALINELSSKIVAYETAIDDKDTLIKELTERLSEASLKADNNEEIVSLKAENAKLVLELNKKHDIERQVGAAMLDARVHSEELVEKAKEEADSVKKAVYSAIGDTAVKIDDLSAGIGEIARNFTKSVEEVELRIKALTGDMSKTAQALISENILSEEVVVEPFSTVKTVEEVEAVPEVEVIEEVKEVEEEQPAESGEERSYLNLADEIEALKNSKEYDFSKLFSDLDFNFDSKIGEEDY